MAIGGMIGRLIGDVLGLVIGIAMFVVGAVVLAQLNSTTLVTAGTGEGTAAITMIGNYSPIGTIIGACFIIIFLSDMINTVRGMASGGQ